MKIKNYNIENNFWEEFPMLKAITPFKDLYKSDKKRGKVISSKLMWALASYVDISSANPLSNQSDEDKIALIESDYINVKFDKVKYKDHISKMRDILLTKEYRALYNLVSKLEQRTKLIEDTDYSIENADKLDKLISGTKGILSAIKEMETMIASGASEGLVKGGRIESLSEKGEL